MRILLAAVLGLLLGRLLAQNPPAPRYHSPLLGQPVPHPESLSGLWETPDGKDGAVGLHLQLTTTVPADVKTLRGVPQSWLSLQIGVYQRKGVMVQFGEQNYFMDSDPDSGLRFEQGRLRLHFVPSNGGLPAVDLDLIQQPDSAWEGRLHRGDFDAHVKLQRPGVSRGFPHDPLVGTWLENPTNFLVSRSCLHIIQQTATEWTGWSDSLTVLGSLQYAPYVSRPTTAEEHYGELMKVQRKPNGSFSFELGAFNSVCCPQRFVGTLAPAGTLLQGAWPTGMNQTPRLGSWRKIPGDSCLASEQGAGLVQH